MKELSVFIDESGDFGDYEPHSPYYIVTLVFHDQAVDISDNIKHLDMKLRNERLPDNPVHTGPLIRRENEYNYYDLPERKRIFNTFYNFARTAEITYHPITVEKKHLIEETELVARIAKQLSAFLRKNLEMFLQYNRVVVYYDYGQLELTNILVTLFNAFLNNVKFKKAVPANYKLFQAADMLCSLELLALKSENKTLSSSERKFFGSEKDLYKSYIRAIRRKRI